MKTIAEHVQDLISTSVQDVVSTLPHVTDARVLNALRAACFEHGQGTKLKHVERRIRQLKRGAQ